VSQISDTTPSVIGGKYLTDDTLVTGRIHLAFLESAAWSPVERAEREVIGGTEIQSFQIGRESGTHDFLIDLFIPYCTDVLYKALEAQCRTLGTTYAASFKLAATSAAGAEQTLTFAALAWVSLVWDTSARFGSRTYTGARARLRSRS
jgi:hypothetical protein